MQGHPAQHGFGRLRGKILSWASLVFGLNMLGLGLALALAVDTVKTVLRLHAALPYFDEWDDLTLYASLRAGASLIHLFDQHNEHRIFFPRLILFADYRLFGGRGILNIASIFVIQTAHIGMILALLRASRLKARHALALAAVVIGLMTSLRQEENFIWGFQVQFVGAFAAATCAFISFAKALQRIKDGSACAWPLAAAFGSVIVATFSLASGLLSGIVLVILALLWRAPRPITLSAAGLTLLLGALYLYGYEPVPGHTPLGLALRQPGALVRYGFAYLGNILYPNLSYALALGACGAIGAAGFLWRFAVGQDRDPIRLALLGIVLFTLGTVMITALGRVAFGTDQAMASRYATVSGVFWSALLIAGWSISGTLRRPVILRGAIAACGALLLAGAVRAQVIAKPDMEERAYALQQSADALRLGLEDVGVFESVYDQTDLMKDDALFLRQEGLSIFAEPETRWLGQAITLAGSIVDPSACSGSFVQASSDPHLGPNGVRVAGHAFTLKRSHVVRRLYLADAQNRIVGYASGAIRRSDGDAWAGYATAPPHVPLTAYALLAGNRLCEIGKLDVAP